MKALYLFGSTARDEAGPASDVDLFVDLADPSGFGLLDLIGLEHRMQDALGTGVDLATRQALKPRMRERIEASAIHVF